MLNDIILGINKKIVDMSISNYLNKSGYNVNICSDGNSLLRLARSRNTDLIIIHDEIKGLRAIDLVNIIYIEKICPVVLLSNNYGKDYFDWIEKGWIYSYLGLPVDYRELIKTVKSAIAIGERIQELENKVLKLQKQIAIRKVIERAKGIIMQVRECSEEQAYQCLKRVSMDKGISIERLAQAIVNQNNCTD